MATSTKTKPKPKARVAPLGQRVATDQGLLKRALRDPGLRAKLPDQYLRPEQRAQRKLNVRLNAPVTPGSSMTERALATAAQAATTTEYAPKEQELQRGLGIAQTQARDTGGFYDDYIARLQAQTQNVQAYQAGAQAALAQTAQGITGLAGADAAQLQQGANAQAAQQGVAPAGNLAPTANAAEASRQNLMGSFQAQQVLRGAANNIYASEQAGAVAPTQKLAAQAQGQQKVTGAQQKLTDLAALKGTYAQKYKAETRASEAKNVLATQLATGKQTLAETQQKETARANRASEGLAGERITSTARTARARLTASERTHMEDLGARAREGRLNRANQRELARLRRKDQQAKDATKKAADEFKNKYGVNPLTTVAHNSARDAIGKAEADLDTVRSSMPKGTPFGTVGQWLTKGVPKDPKDKASIAIKPHNQLFVRVAMDIKQYGGVTPGTADRLHKAGYSVKTLGLPSVKSGPGAIVGALATGLGNIGK